MVARSRVDEDSPAILSESVYERLRHDIISGRYRPGDRLTEREIAEELGVSRIPIRAAINRLEVTGFLRLLPRRTAVVTEVTRADVEELYDLRAALEAVAARTAALRVASGADPGALEQALAASEDALQRHDGEELDRCNARLHQEIAALADHRLLDKTFGPLQDRSDRLSAMTIASDPDVRHDEHRALVGAIVSGNARLAEACAFTHVEQGRQRTLQRLPD
ncbi:GntR family transcriptional regulator [Microbacterium sp.]|uniref:GntR family transcriptional regulator n=1 Tax=Microbacterium sp. TaxID=51671 RepID=UPI0039E43BC2